MLSIYSNPHLTLLAELYQMLHVCKHLSHHGRCVVNAKLIQSLVAMIPFPLTVEEAQNPDICTMYTNCFYVGEKPALDNAQLTWDELEDDEDEVE